MIGGGSFSGGMGSFGQSNSLELYGSGSSSLLVEGGAFSGPMLLELSDAASVRFYGTGLQFDSSTGMLTGTLFDGDPIRRTKTHTARWAILRVQSAATVFRRRVDHQRCRFARALLDCDAWCGDCSVCGGCAWPVVAAPCRAGQGCLSGCGVNG